jgi:hypothetical protein
MPKISNTKTSPLVNLSAATNFSIKQTWLKDGIWLPGNPSSLQIARGMALLNYLPLLGPSVKVLSFEVEYLLPSCFPSTRNILARMMPARMNDVLSLNLSRLHPSTIPPLQLNELNICLSLSGLGALYPRVHSIARSLRTVCAPPWNPREFESENYSWARVDW